MSSARKRSEDALKALVNVDLANKRCVDCNALGPQYVVLSGFGVFTCTRCSGVHTWFGHRVKGIHTSQFTEEELAEIGGNGAFSAVFLGALPERYVKPHAMGREEVKRWIEDVYVKKKYHIEGPNGGGKGVSVASGPPRPGYLDIPEEEISVVPLSDILGANTPILRVESVGADASRQLVEEEVGQKQTVEEEVGQKQTVEPASYVAPADLLGGWDPFGVDENLVMEGEGGGDVLREEGAAFVSSPEPEAPSFQEEWATFVEDVGKEDVDKEDARSMARVANRGTEVRQQGSISNPATPLEAFYPEVDQMKRLQSAADGAGRAAGATTNKIESVATASKTAPPRAAVPLEAFFPEFEQIRRTGVLPTGLPDPTRPQTAVTAAPAAPQVAPPQSAPPPVLQPLRSQNPSAAHRASKTLGFGTPFDGGYDLQAVHAPKPSIQGNPFASL